jgi:hypothetical protein
MTSPIRAGDHYLLRKLCNELLPWMICGKRVGRQWFVTVAILHNYAGDLAAALAGLGIGSPLVAVVAGTWPKDKSFLEAVATNMPVFWFYLGVASAILWVVVRIVVQRQDVLKRALLVSEHRREMNALYIELYRGLELPEPVDNIAKVQSKVNDLVQSAIRAGIWPYDPPSPPEQELEPDLTIEVERIRTRYMGGWKLPDRAV